MILPNCRAFIYFFFFFFFKIQRDFYRDIEIPGQKLPKKTIDRETNFFEEYLSKSVHEIEMITASRLLIDRYWRRSFQQSVRDSAIVRFYLYTCYEQIEYLWV